MVIHDRAEGAQVRQLTMHEPPLWVPPHQVVRSLAPESGPQCIPCTYLPCHKTLDPHQAGDFLGYDNLVTAD